MAMNKEITFDTSQALSDDDYELWENIKKAKRELFAFINIQNFINEAIKIIDESQLLDFKNERARKFIDKKRPLFNLVIDSKLAMETYNKRKFSSENDEAKFYSDVIYNEFISKLSLFIKKSMNTPEGNEILENNLFDDTTSEERLQLNKLSILSSLYAIRLDSSNKNIAIVEILM